MGVLLMVKVLPGWGNLWTLGVTGPLVFWDCRAKTGIAKNRMLDKTSRPAIERMPRALAVKLFQFCKISIIVLRTISTIAAPKDLPFNAERVQRLGVSFSPGTSTFPQLSVRCFIPLGHPTDCE